MSQSSCGSKESHGCDSGASDPGRGAGGTGSTRAPHRDSGSALQTTALVADAAAAEADYADDAAHAAGVAAADAAAAANAAAAAAADSPPPLRSTPDALVYGHAPTVYLQILAAGFLDGDGLADLVVGELPTGTQGDERTESNVLLGRESWPALAGTESLALRKIVEPVKNDSYSFAYLGSGELNGDDRDDLVTVTVRQGRDAPLSVEVGLHWSPETWPGQPNLTRPNVVLNVPSKAVPHAAAVGDVDGDGLADLVLTGEGGVDILLGRRPWPSATSLEPPDVHISPGPAKATLGDVNDDGLADLWLNFDALGVDAALVTGRTSWPATLDGAVDADVSLGVGRHDFSGAIAPDVSADGVPDAMWIDHVVSSFGVYEGGADVAARLATETASWTVIGVTDTYEIATMDLTGDAAAEIIVSRRDVFLGRAGRAGTIDLAADEHDAVWAGLGSGSLWSLDVDGQQGNDVLVSDSSASVRGRTHAGTIAIFLSPLFTPSPVTSTPTPTPPSATPTGVGGSPTPTAGPTSAATATATSDTGGFRLWLPHAGLDR